MKNKKLGYLWIIGIFAIVIGAFLKLNGNLNAEIILFCGNILTLVAIIGLILNNRKRLLRIFQD